MRSGGRWALLGLAVLVGADELASENVTLHTYYPAPSGVYTRMITTETSFLARDSGVVAVGTSEPAEDIKLQVVGDASIDGGLMATGDALLARDGGNVGVGTSEPVARLDVAGGVRIADGTQAAGFVLTADASGFARWSPPSAGTLRCRTVASGGQWAFCAPDEIVTGCGTYCSGHDDQIKSNAGQLACYNDEGGGAPPGVCSDGNGGVWARCCKVVAAP